MIRNNIKKLRRSRNLSQRVLGEALGVRQGLISDWEIGKVQPTEENVEDLASFFDVSPAYVLGKAPERNCFEFDAETSSEEYYAKNFDERDLLEIYRLLPENGKNYLLTTLHMLEKFYE